MKPRIHEHVNVLDVSYVSSVSVVFCAGIYAGKIKRYRVYKFCRVGIFEMSSKSDKKLLKSQDSSQH